MRGVILFVGALAWLMVALAPVNGENSYMNALKHGVSHYQRGSPGQIAPAIHRSASALINKNTPTKYGNQGNGRGQSSDNGGCSDDYNIDYLQLSLQWGPGTCATSPKRCVVVNNQLFSIHGMWPQIKGQQSPAFCCFNSRFNYREIEHLAPMLDKYWFSVYGHNSRSFWSHEWTKHGTCSRDIAKLRGASKFFGSILNIMRQLDILGTLKRNGIAPGPNKIYPSQTVINGVRELTGGKLVQIDCDLEAHQPTPLLTGMNLCFDTSLNFIDCPPSKSRCRRNIMFLN